MFRKLFYVTFGFILASATNFSLIAENNEILNVIYLVPESPCEYVTQGQAHCLNKGSLKAYHHYRAGEGCRISYQHDNDNFSCDFRAPKNQPFIPDIYENAERMPDSADTPGLDMGGFGRGYNRVRGYFEVFEINYDEKGNIASFAADFTTYGEYSETAVRGAVRFNSTYPVDEYFIKMTDPSINWESQNLLYVRKFSTKSRKHEEIIVKDRTNLSISLKENNGLALVVKEKGNCGGHRGEITFHIPSFSALMDSNSFTIRPKLKHQHWDDDDWDDSAYYEQITAGITVEPKWEEDATAFEGNFSISDLVFDVKNNEFLSLAIDFIFKDKKGNLYDGVVRYNSNIPVALE